MQQGLRKGLGRRKSNGHVPDGTTRVTLRLPGTVVYVSLHGERITALSPRVQIFPVRHVLWEEPDRTLFGVWPSFIT